MRNLSYFYKAYFIIIVNCCILNVKNYKYSSIFTFLILYLRHSIQVVSQTLDEEKHNVKKNKYE